MPRTDITNTTTPDTITDYSVDSETTDGTTEDQENFYDNPNFNEFYGNYINLAKVRTRVNKFATWIVGQGWKADNRTTAVLSNIRGWGEDTFLSLLWNMIVIKKVNGDSYAQIIRNEGILINLKPLDPSSIRIVVGKDGLIKRYEQISKAKKPNKIIKTQDMLHLCNDRVADNIHGVSVLEGVLWNLAAQEEAKITHRKMLKRNGVVRIIEVDSDDTAKINKFKVQWKAAIDKGEVIILPKGVAEAKDWHGQLDTNGVLAWINHLDNELDQLLGIPKIIAGGSGEQEGDSKVSYLTFEQVYKREINELKDDLWNQLALRVDFNLPVSLSNTLADNEAKNTSQVGFQSNDTTAGVGE